MIEQDALFITPDERAALYGLPHFTQVLYLHLRMLMDARTHTIGLVGKRISWQALREEMHVDPGRGIPVESTGSPHESKVRRAVEKLMQAGLLGYTPEYDGKLLFFKCIMHEAYFSVQIKPDRNPTRVPDRVNEEENAYVIRSYGSDKVIVGTPKIADPDTHLIRYIYTDIHERSFVGLIKKSLTKEENVKKNIHWYNDAVSDALRTGASCLASLVNQGLCAVPPDNIPSREKHIDSEVACLAYMMRSGLMNEEEIHRRLEFAIFDEPADNEFTWRTFVTTPRSLWFQWTKAHGKFKPWCLTLERHIKHNEVNHDQKPDRPTKKSREPNGTSVIPFRGKSSTSDYMDDLAARMGGRKPEQGF